MPDITPRYKYSVCDGQRIYDALFTLAQQLASQLLCMFLYSVDHFLGSSFENMLCRDDEGEGKAAVAFVVSLLPPPPPPPSL